MALQCGIVGLPNVGKSTLFQALTTLPVEAANYPFCTIEPNVGLIAISDPRLSRIARILGSQRSVPTTLQFVDIAGLVRNASQGAGLGNRFLAHIRETDLIVHVLRCFEDSEVTHVEERVDPVADIETIATELALADLATVERRLEHLERDLKSHDRTRAARASQAQEILLPLQRCLADGTSLSMTSINPAVPTIHDLHLLTVKPQLYVCNVDESALREADPAVARVQQTISDADRVVVVCGQIEAEIAELETADERREFMDSVGIVEAGSLRLARAAYSLLGLATFFTADPKEARAWQFRQGETARQAAGSIHSDMARGFIRADVYHCEDLFRAGSESSVRQAGKLQQESGDYCLKDGDVVYIRFNV